MNPINYWYQKYLSIKKTLDCLIGDNDFIVVQKGEILSSLPGNTSCQQKQNYQQIRTCLSSGTSAKSLL